MTSDCWNLLDHFLSRFLHFKSLEDFRQKNLRFHSCMLIFFVVFTLSKDDNPTVLQNNNHERRSNEDLFPICSMFWLKLMVNVFHTWSIWVS